MASFGEGWALGRRVAEATHHFIKDSEIHQRTISHHHTAASPLNAHSTKIHKPCCYGGEGEKRTPSFCRNEPQRMRRQYLLHPSNQSRAWIFQHWSEILRLQALTTATGSAVFLVPTPSRLKVWRTPPPTDITMNESVRRNQHICKWSPISRNSRCWSFWLQTALTAVWNFQLSQGDRQGDPNKLPPETPETQQTSPGWV